MQIRKCIGSAWKNVEWTFWNSENMQHNAWNPFHCSSFFFAFFFQKKIQKKKICKKKNPLNFGLLTTLQGVYIYMNSFTLSQWGYDISHNHIKQQIYILMYSTFSINIFFFKFSISKFLQHVKFQKNTSKLQENNERKKYNGNIYLY